MVETKAASAGIRTALARFLAEIARASGDQWRFRPAPGSWSMAEVTEHVGISCRNISRLLSRRLLESPIAGRPLGVSDDEIPYLFYRGDEPPNVAAPTGSWTDPADAAAGLAAAAAEIVTWADGTAWDLRAVGVAHPVFGLLDGVQWLLFTAAHTERHRAQLLGLKRHPDFPA